MSATKRLLEEVSTAMGLDGEINAAVCNMAEKVAKLLSDRRTIAHSGECIESLRAAYRLRVARHTEPYYIFERIVWDRAFRKEAATKECSQIFMSSCSSELIDERQNK